MRVLRCPVAVLGVVALLGSSPAKSQDFTGTYQVSGNGTTVTLTLRQARNGQITGTLQGNTTFQVQAQVAGQRFAGYASNQAGRVYLEGQLAGTQLQVAMAEVGPDGQPQPQTARVVAMERVEAGGAGQSGAAAAPRTSKGNAPGAAGGAGAGAQGAAAASPQDQQVTQLLLRSAWCSFSYSGVSGTSSGSSHTERVVFRADGTGARQTGGESYNSGRSGSVAGQSQGGAPFRWQFRGGVLNTSADGVSWAQTRLQITTNSSGYPIITADGKEYTMCN
jgi:hypothetical protein